MAKPVFNKKEPLSTSKLDLKYKQEIVKCYYWSTGLRGSETGTFRKVYRNTGKVLKCGSGEGWRRSVGPIM
jgi:hypothetical protein